MTVLVSDETSIIRAAGEIDVATVSTLLSDVADALCLPGRDVTVDMSTVTFLDAAGLGGVVQLRHDVLAAGRTFHLVGVPPQQARVFVLGHLGSLLPPPIERVGEALVEQMAQAGRSL
jgi:anti-sigma B factor antagonist